MGENVAEEEVEVAAAATAAKQQEENAVDADVAFMTARVAVERAEFKWHFALSST